RGQKGGSDGSAGGADHARRVVRPGDSWDSDGRTDSEELTWSSAESMLNERAGLATQRARAFQPERPIERFASSDGKPHSPRALDPGDPPAIEHHRRERRPCATGQVIAALGPIQAGPRNHSPRPT